MGCIFKAVQVFFFKLSYDVQICIDKAPLKGKNLDGTK